MGSLTSTQHAILIGSLLGDGTLRKQGHRTNALFEVNHIVGKYVLPCFWYKLMYDPVTTESAKGGRDTDSTINGNISV